MFIPIYQPIGDQAVLVSYEERIDPEINERVRFLSEVIVQQGFPWLGETLFSYRSLLVIYHPQEIHFPEVVEAIKKIIKSKIQPDKITEKTISQNLWTSDLDLIIRTGKEQRISNFLIWQAAYSELYFYPKYWPDFGEKDLDDAFVDYANRQRRFGA